MTSNQPKLLQCYNRGCGKEFDPNFNTSNSCCYHSGEPYFHDAYKGWSCCNKKYIDFTEFLNVKGCTISYHNSEKPPEPEKPQKSTMEEIHYVPPIVTEEVRPDFDSPLVLLNPDVSSLKRISEISLNEQKNEEKIIILTEIPIGTSCKNNSCKTSYENSDSLTSNCNYHPGCPVFHEGLKYWSCCSKKTTDFEVFLNQVGCTIGKHVWFKKTVVGEVKCRHEWYQTGSNVIISIYGKNCEPSKSKIEVNPIRLKLSLYFPEQNGYYQDDIELRGVIDTDKCAAKITSSKIEITLSKRQITSWAKLSFPKESKEEDECQPEKTGAMNDISQQVESVDLSCI